MFEKERFYYTNLLQNSDLAIREKMSPHLYCIYVFQLCSDISSDGRTMKCPSPNISGLIDSKIDRTTPEDGRLWFVMDGITALTDTMATDQQWRSFRYYPDPKFYKFTEIDHTKKINIEETSLEIKVCTHHII